MINKYELPLSVNCDGQILEIRNQCDFRIVLDCLSVIDDAELDEFTKVKTCLFIFYDKKIEDIKNIEKATQEMFDIISYNVSTRKSKSNGEGFKDPPLMDWQNDFELYVPSVNRVLGYDVRIPNKYTHWWTFLGAYSEIGECNFTSILEIRKKKMHGEKLEKHEQKFYAENREIIDMPIPEDYEEWLDEYD